MVLRGGVENGVKSLIVFWDTLKSVPEHSMVLMVRDLWERAVKSGVKTLIVFWGTLKTVPEQFMVLRGVGSVKGVKMGSNPS